MIIAVNGNVGEVIEPNSTAASVIYVYSGSIMPFF
jgi:hypothetical protein